MLKIQEGVYTIPHKLKLYGLFVFTIGNITVYGSYINLFDEEHYTIGKVPTILRGHYK
jgi:hypothetical protein